MLFVLKTTATATATTATRLATCDANLYTARNNNKNNKNNNKHDQQQPTTTTNDNLIATPKRQTGTSVYDCRWSRASAIAHSPAAASVKIKLKLAGD